MKWLLGLSTCLGFLAVAAAQPPVRKIDAIDPAILLAKLPPDLRATLHRDAASVQAWSQAKGVLDELMKQLADAFEQEDPVALTSDAVRSKALAEAFAGLEQRIERALSQPTWSGDLDYNPITARADTTKYENVAYLLSAFAIQAVQAGQPDLAMKRLRLAERLIARYRTTPGGIAFGEATARSQALQDWALVEFAYGQFGDQTRTLELIRLVIARPQLSLRPYLAGELTLQFVPDLATWSNAGTLPGNPETALGRMTARLAQTHPDPFDREATLALAIELCQAAIADESKPWSERTNLDERAAALRQGWPDISPTRTDDLSAISDAEAMAALAKTHNPVGRMMIALLIPDLIDARRAVRRSWAETHMVIVALGLRMWSLRQSGALPESLDALVEMGIPAQYLNDPYGKGRINYDKSRRVIWSVAENGTDEGGVVGTPGPGKWEADFAVALPAGA